MRKKIYRLFAKWGYKVTNKNRQRAIVLKKLAAYDVRKNLNILVRQFGSIEKLKAMYPDLEIRDQDAGVVISFGGLQFYVESGEEVFIISEVFYEKDYQFIFSGNAVMVDIGANIGVSSLFFSKMENVEKIYSFEPVEDTYKQAVLNFTMNNVGDKIKFSQFGLGKNDRQETFMFNKNIKGNTGIRGTLSKSYANISETEERTVAIRDAATIFQDIFSENPGKKIIVKMDCEGAEYEIIERLATSGKLNGIDALLIEWHDKGSEVIESQLVQAGFFIFSRVLTENSGMIYAKK